LPIGRVGVEFDAHCTARDLEQFLDAHRARADWADRAASSQISANFDAFSHHSRDLSPLTEARVR
jgi:hypothetical protein